MTTTSPTERVGRYQLLEPIGIGPSGTVSRAKVFGVAGFERQFAVKRFHPELTATAAMAAMLSAAARAYGSLEHPRIARMSEFGVAQGATFTAVEYVPGLDALRLIAEARLAAGSGSGLATGGALALVSQAARAVGYAHGRGLTHLGLAPTNVIVTADGDIKITDFGILSATLPPRPIDVPRLAQRIPYLAPEQLANEATSAATDVFALGVLAYELVTGTRTFKGDTPQQVASAIMNGPPIEPPLPRPIVRVLQRCLARSPFERFPDARALADALDAALRVAPVPGTRKDIGAQVKETLDRFAALNEGQMSGMVALHLGTGPIRRVDAEPRPTMPAARDASAPYQLAPSDPSGAAATLADLPRPMTTVPGLAPPPIPVPPGIASPSSSAGTGLGGSTLVGMGKAPPAIPGKPRQATGSFPPVPIGGRAPTRQETDLEPPPSPAPVGASTESAIHTLDPSDLLSIDALPDELDGGTLSNGDLGGGTIATPASELPASEVTGLPGAASVDDFSDAPTHALAGSAAAATLRPRAQEPQTTYRLDPSSIDTKPIPPVTLEPLLEDPSARPGGPDGRDARDGRSARESRGPERRPVLDEDRWFEDSSAGRAAPTGASSDSASSSGSGRIPLPAAATNSGRVAAPLPTAATNSGRVVAPLPTSASTSTRIPSGTGAPGNSSRIPISGPGATPGSGRVPSSEPGASEPKLGHTILGYAPPVGSPRATPSAPFPPAESLPPERSPEDELPVPSMPPERMPPAEAPGDQLSELMLEGFRTAPASEQDSLDGGAGWQEQSAIAPSPAPAGWQEQSAIGPSPAPSAWQEQSAILPTPAPSGWQEQSAIGPSPAPSAWQEQRAILPTPAPSGWQEQSAILPTPAPSGWDGSAVLPTPAPAGAPPLSVPGDPPPRRSAIWIAVGILGAAVLGVGAWQLYEHVIAPPTSGPIAITTHPDQPHQTPPPRSSGAATGPVTVATDAHTAEPAATPPAATPPAATPPAATPPAATPPAGAGSGTGSGSAQVVATPPRPAPGPGDSLTISSNPPGARVFLDGADAGVTPLHQTGTADRHNLALLLAGHELYVTKVDGHGTFEIPLKEVTPTSGPAGIKVLRCKDKDRYYVFVDGKPTGQTCPTERIECEVGPHTVEVYDVVSENRRKWDIVVKDTRLSFRVRVE
ncbi:MAG TPA: protein kinase [Kofleriaceae bacterium]|nr:protein kinase [Kofleriaceae bacterium]